MAELHKVPLTYGGHSQHQVTGKTVFFASLAGVVLAGPLLAMMGITFVATMTLLVVSFPLLVIFSPILFLAGVFFVGVLTSLAAAGAMSVAGVSTLAWVFWSYRPERMLAVIFGETGKMIEYTGDGMKELGKADYPQEAGRVSKA